MPAIADDLPEKIDWATLLERTGTKPIVIAEGSKSTEEFEASRKEWVDARVVAPELARLKGATDEKEVREFFENAVPRWAFEQVNSPKPEWIAAAEKIISGETRRPLVDFFAACVLSEAARGKEALQGFRHVAEAGYETLIPSLFRVLAQAQVLSHTESRDKGNTKKETERYFEILAAHLSEAPADEEDAHWRLYHHLYPSVEDIRKNREKRHIELYQKSQLPEWARLTLAGETSRGLAWRESGEGMGRGRGKPEDIRKYYADAGEWLTKAWELKPTMPYAATVMIVVLDKGRSATAEVLRLWLDRAAAAQFDSLAAYSNYLRGIRPFWGGDEEQLLAFGWACAQTGRFDSNLPTRLNSAVFGIAYGREDWRAVYRHPSLTKVLLETREKRMQSPTNTPAMKLNHAAQLCVEAWASGDMERAAKALDSMRAPGGEIRYAADGGALAWQLGVDEKFTYGEAWMHHGPAREDYVAGRVALAAGKAEEAVKRLEAAAGKVEKEATAFAQGMVTLAKFQQAYEKGEWTKLPAGERHCWLEFDGENLWDAKRERLVLTGDWIFGKSLFRGSLGKRFEVRGHFTTKPKDRSGAGFGIYSGHSPLTTGRGASFWWSLRVDKWYDKENGIHFAPKYDGDTPNVVKIPRDDDASFLYRRDGGKVSFYVNDKEIVKDKRIDEDARGDEGAWGLGVLGDGKGAAAEVWALEARRLGEE